MFILTYQIFAEGKSFPPTYSAWVEEVTHLEMGTLENIQYVFVTETE